jgi:hypothetical protein
MHGNLTSEVLHFRIMGACAWKIKPPQKLCPFRMRLPYHYRSVTLLFHHLRRFIMRNTPDKDAQALEDEVRKAVEEGFDVQERVRQITLRIMRERSFDIESVRQTVNAVLRGARAGVQKDLKQSGEQARHARDHLKQAVTGLDVALAQFAEAAKLAVEEATGRAQRYSSEDLVRARADLERLERMFVESLQSAASATKDAAGDILHDLAAHARTQGSAVGRQMKDTLASLARQLGRAGSAEAGIGLHLARNTSDLLRQIAAGMLTGLADHVRPSQHDEKAR